MVRPVVEAPDGVRLCAAAALDPLERAVGHLLDQYEVSWLLLRALNAKASPSAEAGAYPTPGWAERPEVKSAGAELLKVVTALAAVLDSHGVKLDPNGIADRLVLAQLLTLDVPWDRGARAVVRGLNVGSIRWTDPNGRRIGLDDHGGDREDRAISAIARGLHGRLRSYPEREGLYDEPLRHILAERPGVTAGQIVRALDRTEDWAEGLQALYTDRGPDDFRRTLQRALNRLRK